MMIQLLMFHLKKMMTRKYFHFSDLEECTQGMWAIVRGDQRKINSENAASLMRNSQLFKKHMMSALTLWPNSCLHNLSAEAVNKIAWLGHAGCFLGVGSPEENTRVGWHLLSPNDQAEANKVAAEVLEQWELANKQKEQLELF